MRIWIHRANIYSALKAFSDKCVAWIKHDQIYHNCDLQWPYTLNSSQLEKDMQTDAFFKWPLNVLAFKFLDIISWKYTSSKHSPP